MQEISSRNCVSIIVESWREMGARLPVYPAVGVSGDVRFLPALWIMAVQTPRSISVSSWLRPLRISRWRMRGMSRSEEHTSELQSLMRISYAVFCLKKKNKLQCDKHMTAWSETTQHSISIYKRYEATHKKSTRS